LLESSREYLVLPKSVRKEKRRKMMTMLSIWRGKQQLYLLMPLYPQLYLDL
jgi:hypothetical protein